VEERNNGDPELLLLKPDVGRSSSKQLWKKETMEIQSSSFSSLMWVDQAPNNCGRKKQWSSRAPPSQA
jgi:hypothetical protein